MRLIRKKHFKRQRRAHQLKQREKSSSSARSLGTKQSSPCLPQSAAGDTTARGAKTNPGERRKKNTYPPRKTQAKSASVYRGRESYRITYENTNTHIYTLAKERGRGYRLQVRYYKKGLRYTHQEERISKKSEGVCAKEQHTCIYIA